LAWASFDPRLDTPLNDLAVMFVYIFLLIYGGVLLRLRSMRLS